MANFYTGPSGSSGNAGTSWAARKLTIAQGLALLATAGDVLYIGPGTYREGSLGAPSITLVNYSTGTVAVTKGSATVTGTGTTFTGNVFANGIFQIQQIAHGTDGVTNGTGTFTSAAGNFQSGMIGMTIRINAKAAYIISAVASATSITITDVTGGAVTPSAGSSLTYDVGPESPYEILSVDSNTQITLKNVWSGPSLTLESYQTWRDVKVIGDESGLNTDGIGGEIRLTGSDNDQTATRSTAFNTGRSNVSYRGMHFDIYSSNPLTFTAGINCIFEQCEFHDNSSSSGISISGAALTGNTVRKCEFRSVGNTCINFSHTVTQDNQAGLVENCRFVGLAASNQGVLISRIGGTLVRNCTFIGINQSIRVSTSPAVGQCLSVNNCIIVDATTGFTAVATTDILEDYNALFGNATARSNTSIGQHSNTFPPIFSVPLLTLGILIDMFGFMNSASPLASIAGLNPPVDDLYGTTRTATSSWGAIQYVAGQRPVDAGLPRSRVGQ